MITMGKSIRQILVKPLAISQITENNQHRNHCKIQITLWEQLTTNQNGTYTLISPALVVLSHVDCPWITGVVTIYSISKICKSNALELALF